MLKNVVIVLGALACMVVIYYLLQSLLGYMEKEKNGTREEASLGYALKISAESADMLESIRPLLDEMGENHVRGWVASEEQVRSDVRNRRADIGLVKKGHEKLIGFEKAWMIPYIGSDEEDYLVVLWNRGKLDGRIDRFIQEVKGLTLGD